MKLLDHITEFEPIYWDYYQGNWHNRKLSNPFATNESHVRFIEGYFKLSGKSILIESFPIKVFKLNRPSHVTSTFFLGLIIIIKCNLNKLGLKSKNLPGYDTLPFLWFLTTLFHDFAEGLEDNPEFVNEIKTLGELITRYQITNNILERKIEHVPPIIFKSIENYFKLRREQNKVDHGIHAGVFMFDSLVKNRIAKKELNLDNHLFWHESLDEQYAIASASIAIHNIWVAQKHVDYQRFGLDGLANFKGYSISEYPIPYIFGLVDTIDPVKFFTYKRNIEMCTVLDSISFEFQEKSILITNGGLDKEKFNEYYHTMRLNLQNWLKHKMSMNEGSIELQIL